MPSNWSPNWIFLNSTRCSSFLGDLCELKQGLLKIWTEHSHWFLLISIPFEVVQQKFQHFYNLERNEFSPNLKGMAQKMDPPRPFEVLDVFGRKSKSEAPKAFKFGFWKLFFYIVGDTWKTKNLKIWISQK